MSLLPLTVGEILDGVRRVTTDKQRDQLWSRLLFAVEAQLAGERLTRAALREVVQVSLAQLRWAVKHGSLTPEQQAIWAPWLVETPVIDAWPQALRVELFGE